jgi:diaminopimelate epimerase
MKLIFHKYQGTGNDFVMIDNREGNISLSEKQIQNICNRRFGIGADGLILINQSKDCDFYIDYYNSDGTQSFCGNGARCAVAFIRYLGLKKDSYTFGAVDGVHSAKFISDERIELEMLAPSNFETIGNDYYIYTGSPHYIRFCTAIDLQNILEIGRSIRYNDRFKKEGVNVNLVERKPKFSLRTYERGVENETYSCGTGATAAILVDAIVKKQTSGSQTIQVKGGQLEVSWDSVLKPYDKVYLIGPAKKVYSGSIDC